MELAEKLLNLRSKRGLTQEQVAKDLGLAKRSIIRYEAGDTLPRRNVLMKLAEYYEVDLDYLIDDKTAFVMSAQEEYGSRGKASAEKLIENANAYFSGGDVSDEDLDKVMKALQNAYWKAKEINKTKYDPYKNRRGKDGKSDKGKK